MREANELQVDESVSTNLLVPDFKAKDDSRSAHFDEMLRERSPYTGVLEQPRNSREPKTNLARPFEPDNRFEPELGDDFVSEPWDSHGVSRGLKQVAMVAVLLLAGGLGVFGSMFFQPAEAGEAQEIAKASVLPETSLLLEKKQPVVVEEPEVETQPTLSPAVEPATPEEPVVVDETEPMVAFDEMFDLAKRTRGRSKRVAAIRNVIEAYPQGDVALSALAIMLMESSKTHEETIDLALRATEINPDNAEAWLALGYAKQLAGAKSEASDAYQKCAASSGPKKYVRECKLLK
jgi:hypothetical protein